MFRSLLINGDACYCAVGSPSATLHLAYAALVTTFALGSRTDVSSHPSLATFSSMRDTIPTSAVYAKDYMVSQRAQVWLVNKQSHDRWLVCLESTYIKSLLFPYPLGGKKRNKRRH